MLTIAVNYYTWMGDCLNIWGITCYGDKLKLNEYHLNFLATGPEMTLDKISKYYISNCKNKVHYLFLT